MANPDLANLYLIRRLNGVYSEVPADQVGLAIGKSGALNFSFENFGIKSEITGIGSNVLGGASNSSYKSFAVGVGGIFNRSSGEYSSLGGGQVNKIKITGATMFGGILSTIDNFRLDAFNQSPFGPKYCYVDNTASTIFNTELTFMTSKAGVIGGGSQHDAMGNFSVIGGGSGHSIGQPGQEINGGPSFGTIFGGQENRIGLYVGTDEGYGSTNIGSINGLAFSLGVILGDNNSSYGGYGNAFFGAQNSAGFYDKQTYNSTLVGSRGIALGTGSTIVGGWNKISTHYSTVLGGTFHQLEADYSTSLGGRDNRSFSAFGYTLGGETSRVLSNHSGAGVFAGSIDSYNNPNKVSMGPNTFTISFQSGIYLKNTLFFKRINPIESADSVIKASGFFV